MTDHPAPPHHTLLDGLLSASGAELRERLEGGHRVTADALAGQAFRGVSLGLPAFVERLTWKTFCKTVHRDPATGALRGWNVRVEQTGVYGPVVYQRKREAPVTFGHFAVLDGPDGLVLDYGRGGNGLDPTALVRDPVVALVEGSIELLLGRSDVALGGLRLRTPSYFVLQPAGPLDHDASP